ncbi:MAG: 50S ribosomal protein L3 N(5)-glutamine methyltransferase, partial [Gammaproteobacteria bacterium]
MKLGDVLQQVYEALESADLYYGHGTDNAWDEAVCLVLCAANLPIDSGQEVLAMPLDQTALTKIQEWTRRRIEERLPLPYLTGRAWFAGLEFNVVPGTLIPRSPIAELIEQQFAPWCVQPPEHVLDLCTGGGCIAAAIAYHLPESQVDGVDLDPAAVELARENVRKLRLESRVNIYLGDLFSPVEGKQYDLIVSNPPYVDAQDMENLPEEYRHEPVHALA